MRIHYYRFPEGTPENITSEHGSDEDGLVSGCSISHAKALLKQYGGAAWTDHFDRDGGFFESSPIVLKGNNSRVKYNRHL